MKLKLALGSAFFLFALSSCVNKTEIMTNESKTQYINFIGTIHDQTGSRADGTFWSPKDSIGVFMLNAENHTTLKANAAYVTLHGNGSFNSVDLPITYPSRTQDPALDFVAYYPYNKDLMNTMEISLDVTNQSNLEKLDLLYSNNLKGINKASGQLTLEFNHVLTKLLVNIDAPSTMEGLTATIEGLQTTAKFDLSNGTLSPQSSNRTDIQLKMGENNTYAQAILIPQSLSKPLQIKLAYQGKTRTVNTTIAESLRPGYKYVVNIKIDGGMQEVIPEASYTKWTETPFISKATLDDPSMKYITHYYYDKTDKKQVRNYAMLYSQRDKFAYWVAYPLCNYYRGNSGRTEQWGYDPTLPKDWQAPMFSGIGSGYDRGHQIPSGDRTKDDEINATTYYFSNMTAQIGKAFNQGIWVALESKIRDSWTSATDTVFIVTGALPTTNDNPERMTYKVNGVTTTVPRAYFKAVARKLGGKYYAIGFYMPHKSYSDNKFMNYAVSVDSLEKLTHFKFFPRLDPSIKRTLDLNNWK